jgi:mercuric ion transport protein
MTEPSASEPKPPKARRWADLFAGGGLFAGFGALLGASCCVLPILLAQAGVSAALLANLGVLSRARPFFLAVALLFVVGGVAASFWKGRRPRPRAVILLAVAALLTAGAYVMPHYEREILDWLDHR